VVAEPSWQCHVRTSHRIANRAKENGGKCPREHFVRENLQNAPPQFATIFFFCPCARSGKVIGI